MPTSKTDILTQLQKPHSFEIILALDPDEWQNATQVYDQVKAPMQTKVKRLNELVELSIAIEKSDKRTFGRQRLIKLNSQYKQLYDLLNKINRLLADK